jgi:SAM-dependent methyltransferase
VSAVLVVGAGSGRQYRYLAGRGLDVRGFDISPTLVDAARERHPSVETVVDDLLGAENRHAPADAVLSVSVLQHVAPDKIGDAVRAVTSLARNVVVLRELVWAAKPGGYQWAHDYVSLFTGWTPALRVETDSTDRGRVELQAFIRDRPPGR